MLTADVRARRHVAAWEGLQFREDAVLDALQLHLVRHQEVLVTPFDMLLYPGTTMAFHAWYVPGVKTVQLPCILLYVVLFATPCDDEFPV